MTDRLEIDQSACINAGIDLRQGIFLMWFAKFAGSGKMMFKEFDGKIFWWCQSSKILDDLPILGIETVDGVRQFVGKMITAGLLERCVVDNCKTYLCLSRKAADVFFKDKKPDSRKDLDQTKDCAGPVNTREGVQSSHGGGSREVTGHIISYNNRLIINKESDEKNPDESSSGNSLFKIQNAKDLVELWNNTGYLPACHANDAMLFAIQNKFAEHGQDSIFSAFAEYKKAACSIDRRFMYANPLTFLEKGLDRYKNTSPPVEYFDTSTLPKPQRTEEGIKKLDGMIEKFRKKRLTDDSDCDTIEPGGA